jgi:CheY-like chemotaxis protein
MERPISPISPIGPISGIPRIFRENNMKLRTLIVEDDKYQADAISYILQATDERQMKDAGIDGFEITVVNCAADARKALDRAGRDAAAYDLLLLDLGLPENPGEDEKPEMGIELLKLAKDQEAARGIIVISVFTDLERYAMLAATDFIGKPYGKEELQTRALGAWKAVREKHRHRKFSERDLALYANIGIIYRLSSCFSRLVHSAQREAEELRGELLERFGESQTDVLPEPIARRLAAMEGLIRRARDEWKEIQEPFQITGDTPRGLAVEEEIRRFAEELRPCIAVKLEPPADPADYDMRILSFKDAFRNNTLMIIREILTGGLSETKKADHSTLPEVVVNIEKNAGMAEISFRDGFIPIPADQAEQITKGEIIPPRDGQWRAWGLSVAQQVALRGGGRLIVEPLEGGNLITYRVTLAHDV